MCRYLHHILILLLALMAPLTSRGLAAENESTVKVALLDVSAVMPMGMMGYGMMGPGMMGPGMMGPGTGYGYGMMGNPGVMGPGMMGMMSIRLDKATVKPGAVTFDVTNWSRSVLHEMMIVSVESSAAPLPYDYPQARVPEDQVKVRGETGDLQPNSSNTFEVTLAPGSYLLICNLPGHYAAGMVAPLTVTP